MKGYFGIIKISGPGYILCCFISCYVHAIIWREHEYYFSSNVMLLSDAIAVCANRGGLSSILSHDENEFIAEQAGETEYWIGLTTDDPQCGACNENPFYPDNCDACRAKWYWTDGSPVSYHNWLEPNEPSGGSDCVRIESGWWWDATECASDMYGALCKRAACVSTVCGEHGQCYVENGNTRCYCEHGYTGKPCTAICNSNVCGENGRCFVQNGYAQCNCDRGYSGKPCTDTDECIGVHCSNGGECINETAQFRCMCRQGYTGRYCETETDECESNPCHNGATCIDLPAYFTCNCAEGYTDTLCKTNIDECAGINCYNGTCKDRVATFTCECYEGFAGRYCETAVKTGTDEQSDNSNGQASREVVLGASLGCSVVIIVALLVIIAVILIRRRNSSPKELRRKETTVTAISQNNPTFVQEIREESQYAEIPDENIGYEALQNENKYANVSHYETVHDNT